MTNETPINSTYLSQEELSNFKDQLLDERTQTLEEIDRLEQSIEQIENKLENNVSSSAHHQGDLGNSEELRETNYTLIEKQKDKLEQIAAALDRIETGNYGICIVTGKNIKKGRLEAMPYALHAFDAKNGTISPKEKEQLAVEETQ